MIDTDMLLRLQRALADERYDAISRVEYALAMLSSRTVLFHAAGLATRYRVPHGRTS